MEMEKTSLQGKMSRNTTEKYIQCIFHNERRVFCTAHLKYVLMFCICGEILMRNCLEVELVRQIVVFLLLLGIIDVQKCCL